MRGTVTLNATASDASAGVASVTIQRAPNGTSTWTDVCTDTVTPYSCSLDTTTVSDGLYDFRAVTVDNAGNSTNSSSQTSKRVDNTQPTISSFTVPASNLSGTVTLSASVSDAGSGVSSVLMQRAPTGTSTWTDICTDPSTPYSCSFDTTAVSDGDYDFRATTTDAAGNATTSSTVTRHVDNPPVAVDVQAANGSGTPNRPDAGDVVTYTFSEPMAPASILAGWNGTTKTNITVKVVDGGNNDTVQVFDGATQLNIGTHDLKADFITTGTASLASSSIQMSGSSLIVTLGGTASFTGGGAWNSAPGAKNMQWTASASAKDLAGNSAQTTKITEQGGSDADF
jgi:hypothetical protein